MMTVQGLDIARHVLLDIELFSIFRGRVQFNDFSCIVFILLCVYFIVTETLINTVG
jgi:hypothetical protein